MAPEGMWTAEDHVTAGGRSPMRKFISGLSGRELAAAKALVDLVKERGDQLRPPHSKALGGGLFELRRRQVRIFYMFRAGRRVVLLDGMVKKQDEIPAKVLKRLRMFQEEVRRMDEKEERGP